jgi:hypothetical protein
MTPQCPHDHEFELMVNDIISTPNNGQLTSDRLIMSLSPLNRERLKQQVQRQHQHHVFDNGYIYRKVRFHVFDLHEQMNEFQQFLSAKRNNNSHVVCPIELLSLLSPTSTPPSSISSSENITDLLIILPEMFDSRYIQNLERRFNIHTYTFVSFHPRWFLCTSRFMRPWDISCCGAHFNPFIWAVVGGIIDHRTSTAIERVRTVEWVFDDSDSDNDNDHDDDSVVHIHATWSIAMAMRRVLQTRATTIVLHRKVSEREMAEDFACLLAISNIRKVIVSSPSLR